MICCHWYFRCSDQSLVIPFHPICVFFSAREISGTDKAFRIDDIRNHHRGESFFYEFFQSILKDCLFEQHSIALEKIAASSCELHSSFHINHIILFHERHMVFRFKIKIRNFPECFDHDIFGFIFADRYIRMQSGIWHRQ